MVLRRILTCRGRLPSAKRSYSPKWRTANHIAERQGISCKVSRVCSKVSRAIGFLKYAKKFVPKETLIQMYRGIVEPHFYIVSNSSYDTSATLLIKNLKWLTVTDMIKSETATMTYKAITVLTPCYLANLCTKNTDRNIDINLRNTANDLYIPRMTTSKGQKAISYRGAKTWNQHSLDMKEANSLNSFKCKLKHHLEPTV